MLEDRDYMREESAGRFGSLPPISAWLVILVLNILVFIARNVGGESLREGFFRYGGLSLYGLKHGYLWQLVTFQFMHGSLSHLALNSIALFFFARPMESYLGTRNFLGLYLSSGFIGGLLQLLLSLFAVRFGGEVVGASAGICGLVAAYALLNPHSTIYLFMILPLRAIYFLPIVTAITVLSIILPSNDHVAHGAHLGGILTGAAWIKFGWHRTFGESFGEGFWERWRHWRPRPSRDRKRELVRAASSSNNTRRESRPEPKPELATEDFISKEVDPILDKISTHGIHSLTDKERKILEAARKKMAK